VFLYMSGKTALNETDSIQTLSHTPLLFLFACPSSLTSHAYTLLPLPQERFDPQHDFQSQTRTHSDLSLRIVWCETDEAHEAVDSA